MGFGRKKRKGVKAWVLIVLFLIIIAGVSFGGYFYHDKEMSRLMFEHNEVISQLEAEKDMLSKLVLVPCNNMVAGEMITDDNLVIKQIYTSVESSEFVTPEDYGSVLMIDVDVDIPITKSMVTKENVGAEIREQELGMLMLPSNISRYDYVDIRIGFSNGEDYIVLTKKRVEDVDTSTNTLWIWLSEAEILTLSSAIVDAYVHEGTKLYALTYVRPEIQDSAVCNYPVNEDVQALMLSNPNIVSDASVTLNSMAREALDTKLGSISSDQIRYVESGINDEESKREQVVVRDEAIESSNKASAEINSEEIAVSNNETEGEGGENDDGFY